MGKSTISMAIFNSNLLVDQRVSVGCLASSVEWLAGGEWTCSWRWGSSMPCWVSHVSTLGIVCCLITTYAAYEPNMRLVDTCGLSFSDFIWFYHMDMELMNYLMLFAMINADLWPSAASWEKAWKRDRSKTQVEAITARVLQWVKNLKVVPVYDMKYHEMTWNDIHISSYIYIYIILYIFFSRFYKQMSTSKHVFHAELPVGNPQWFFPISRLTCQKSRARRPIFLVFEPSSSHGRSRGVLWGFLGDSLWPCDSLHPGEKPWITDAMGFSWIFQCLRLPEAYVRLLSCSHQPDMKRWKDRKVKERTSRDSKQQLLTQFLGVERLNLERNPG